MITALPLDIFAQTSSNLTEFAGGDGTANNPYLVANKTHLNNVRKHLSAYFLMIDNIELSESDFAKGGAFYNDGLGWIPIGKNESRPFTGVFNGDNFHIAGLVCYNQGSGKIYSGLFGFNSGTIKHLGVLNGSIKAYSIHEAYAGGISAKNYYGTISDCYNTSIVEARASVSTSHDYVSIESDAYAGGIVGYNDSNCTIQDCYNDGKITSYASCESPVYTHVNFYDYAYAGGIAGKNDYSDIIDCHNTGPATSASLSSSCSNKDIYSGGIVGYNTSDSSISDSYNTGYIYAEDYAGGISGYHNRFSIINNCYNAGKVYSTYRSGGIVGENRSSIINSYNKGIIDSAYSGGIAGQNSGDIITCYNMGSITATVYAGGIVGENRSDVSYCYNTGKIRATSSNVESKAYAGGIAGCNTDDDSSISSCYNSGSVTAEIAMYAGGIASYNGGMVQNCYNKGDITTLRTYLDAYAGGIVAVNKADGKFGKIHGIINNCYNIGDVTFSTNSSSSVAYAAGIAADNQYTIQNCYYLDNLDLGICIGTDDTTKCTADQMTNQDTFVGFDFDLTWSMSNLSDYYYPVLREKMPSDVDEQEPDGTPDNTIDFLGGNGTASNPYLIANKNHLNNVRNYLSAHFRMVENIEFTETDFTETGLFYNNGQNWEAIGKNEETAFTGVFDGAGFYIKGLICSTSKITPAYAGLFGYNNGTIKNLGLLDCVVTGTSQPRLTSPVNAFSDSYAGAFAGFNNGTISCCYNKGSSVTANAIYHESARTSSSSYAGGIAGSNAGTISFCNNTGDIAAKGTTATSDAGGIAGVNTGTISKCYNTGTVIAGSLTSFSGGIAGHNYGPISDCYNTGSIKVGDYIGGITGYNTSRIRNCYNTGYINASDYAGGIVGYNHGTIRNGYYTNPYKDAAGIGGGTEGNTVLCNNYKLQQQSRLVGFDFDAIWIIDDCCDYLFPQLRNNRQELFESIKIIEDVGSYQTIEGMLPKSLDGLSIKLTYANGRSKVMSATPQMLSELDIHLIGTQNIHLLYEKKRTEETFAMEVIAKTLTTISISTKPTKLTYLEGKDDLNVDGGKLTLTYNNRTSEEVDLTSDMVSGFDNTKLGSQTLTVSYQGKTANFTVTICPPAPPAPTLSGKTDTTVTLKAVVGCEYRIDNGTWQKSHIFTGLAPNSTHSFYQRVAETDSHAASQPSSALSVTTDKTNAPSTEPTTKPSTKPSTQPTTQPMPVPTVTTTQDSTTTKTAVALPSGTKLVNGEIIAHKQKKASIKKLKAGKKSLTAYWKKVSGVSGYQVQYSTSKKFTKKTTKSKLIKKNKTTKVTLKKLKSKKKYYVRIRTYKNVKINGKTKKVYSKWSKTKSVKVK